MGLFDSMFKLFQGIFTSNNQQANSNEEKRVIRSLPCPYNCQYVFDPLPEKDANCPTCHQKVLLRKDLKTEQPVLLTKKQVYYFDQEAARIEEENFIRRLCQENNLDYSDFLIQKKILGERGGFSDLDVLWKVLNKQSIKFSNEKKWGMYRNIRRSMTEILEKKKLHEKALSMYLEICYYDLNGASDHGNVHTRKNQAPFSKEYAFIDPDIITKILTLKKAHHIRMGEIQKRFIDENSEIINPYFIITPEKAWLELEKALDPTPAKATQMADKA